MLSLALRFSRVNSARQPRLIFITGTDTGVGKTVLTALLLSHLRSRGCPALAIKPFCSGPRTDVILLHRLQNGELPLDQINPFYFREPLAPFVAARMHSRSTRLAGVLTQVGKICRRLPRLERSSARSPALLIEGAGGLLAPLGEGFCALDLIASLRCEVIVVSPNKLGAINHTLLTVRALLAASGRFGTEKRFSQDLKIVLMSRRKPDPSAASNPAVLSELLAPVPVFDFPFLGPGCRQASAVTLHARRQESLLASILRRA